LQTGIIASVLSAIRVTTCIHSIHGVHPISLVVLSSSVSIEAEVKSVLSDGARYLCELRWRVVGQVEALCKAATQSWIGIHKHLHLVLIAGQNHEQVGAVVLDFSEEHTNSLAGECVATTVNQRVSLIDEEAAAHGISDGLLHGGPRLSTAAA
jgi:hypothetical protein